MILLFPGWFAPSASLIPLQRGLRRRLDVPVERGDLGLGLGCIRASAVRALEQIERLAPSDRVDVVGHSMGGLVATYALKHLDRGRRIRTVVTLGTPHRGSPALAATRWPGTLSRSVSQMSPRSGFRRELDRAPVPSNSRLVSIAALEDGLVPTLYARLSRRPRQFNRDVRCGSHLALLYSGVVADAIVRALRPPNVDVVRLKRRTRVPVYSSGGGIGGAGAGVSRESNAIPIATESTLGASTASGVCAPGAL
jgi:pimeloyl-ACP methyl ester carboxylesterase